MAMRIARSFFGLVLGVLFLTPLIPLSPARAALVWGESDQHGSSVTHWARGGTVNEATNLLRAYAGEQVNVLLSCRQPGWYAYVGSSRDTRRGFSCGYDSRVSALFKARVACENEGGPCDEERVGYDTGDQVIRGPATGIPEELPGPTNDRSNARTHRGPLLLQPDMR